jgi:hypothetical protein
MQRPLFVQDEFCPQWVENRSRRCLRQLAREQGSKRYAVNTNQYVPLNTSTSQDTTRGPSYAIWGSAKIDDALQDPSLYMHMYEDFKSVGNTSSTAAASFTGSLACDTGWSFYADTHGVLGTDPNFEGGTILLSDGGNTTVNVSLTSSAGWAGFVAPVVSSVYALKRKMWFECRVAVGSITTAKRDAFIGLTDTGAPAVNNVIGSTTNTLATAPGLFGFHFRSTTNPTDVGVAYNVAGGTVQYPTALQTLVNTVTGSPLVVESATAGIGAGFVKLGWVYNPEPSNPSIRCVTATGSQTVGTLYKPMIQFYVNGILCPIFMDSTMIQAATFPTTFLAPAISYLSRSATTAGGFYIDWIRCMATATI